MVADALEMAVGQSGVSRLDVPFFDQTSIQVEEIMAVTVPSPKMIAHHASSFEDRLSTNSPMDAKARENHGVQPPATDFVPRIRSGSFADKGPRRCMEDEHLRIDDLSSFFGTLYQFPVPSAFYGVFDGHGGPEAAAYVRKNATRLFFEDAVFPQSCVVNDLFIEEVEISLRKAFLMADIALSDESSVSSTSGTTALTAFVFERVLMVANAGDCRAVLSRKGVAVDMSHDHRPSSPSERRRVEESGGYVDDGYLNGVLSVSRALGDWEMKLSRGSPSPLIAEPELQKTVLTDEDEFLIIGCDGIWDVMSSQHAVDVVRRELRRHGDLNRCARHVAMEALRSHTFDNLTVVVVSFSQDTAECEKTAQTKKRCSLSSEALSSLKNLLDSNSHY